MDIIEYNDTYKEKWQSFVTNYGTLYHDIRWKYVIANTYNLVPKYYIFLDDNKIKGIFPLFQMSSKELVSLPYLPFAGPIYENKQIADKYFTEFVQFLKMKGILKLIVRQKDNIVRSNSYVTMIKKLEHEEEIAFRNLKPRLRNKIRNAKKQPFKLIPSSIEQFYAVYVKATNALGTPPHKMAFFKNILYSFGESVRIHNLYYDKLTVGTIFEIDYLSTRYNLWIFSFKEYFRFQPNIFIYWQTIQDSIRKGLRYYDFGRSVFEEGAYYFKKQWGTKPVGLAYRNYDLSRDDLVPILQPPIRAKLLPKIWSKIPLIISNKIGPLIRKYILY